MKSATLFVALFLSVLLCYAQGPYSKQNLKQLSFDELNFKFNRAADLRIGGLVGVGTGVVFVLGSYIGYKYNSGNLGLAGAAFAAYGLLFIAVGLPISIIGITRVKRIKNEFRLRSEEAHIELSTCVLKNGFTTQRIAGFSVSFRF